ncbi:MAG: hypothetical protein ACT4QD_21185 [Acidobacteriota bacterium]
MVARAKARDVLVLPFSPHKIRVVTHRDVSREECVHAAEVLVDVIEGGAP